MPIMDAVNKEASELVGAEPPPAAEESWANPMDGGDEARNTEYTFLRKVAPTTQEGLSPPAGISLPKLKSKTEPTQRRLPLSVPMFISTVLILHDLPPKAIVTETLVVQGNV